MAVNDDMKPLSGKLSFELEVKMGELITPERLALPLVILFQNSDGFVKVGKVVIELDISKVRTRMYKEGDIYVVELAILRRTLFVCSHASEFTFSSETYLELLKLAEHDL